MTRPVDYSFDQLNNRSYNLVRLYRTTRRQPLPLPVHPYTVYAHRLRATHITHQIIPHHLGRRRCDIQLFQGMQIYPPMRFPNAELSLNQDRPEQRRQPGPLDLGLLLLRRPVGNQG